MMKDLLPRRRRGSLLRHRSPSMLDLMEDFWRRPLGTLDRFPFETEDFPAMDVSEDEKEVKVTAELPGLGPDDIEVSITQGRLTIKGEKNFEDEKKKGNYHRIERSYGSFQRAVVLPTNVDESTVEATYKDGVLQLIIPKIEKEKPVKIKVKS